MRITVVTLGLSVIIPITVAAQASSPTPERLPVTPAHPYRPSLDFGLDKAKQRLPEGPWRLVTPKVKHQLPMQPSESLLLESSPQTSGVQASDCAMVKKHNHGPSPMIVIPPPKVVEHQLKTLPVTPCPVR